MSELPDNISVETTKVTVVLEVNHADIEQGFSPVGWVEQELGWLQDSGISVVEIKTNNEHK